MHRIHCSGIRRAGREAPVEARADLEAGAGAGAGIGQGLVRTETPHGIESATELVVSKETEAGRGTGLPEKKGSGMLGGGTQTIAPTVARGVTESAGGTTLGKETVAVIRRATAAVTLYVTGTGIVTETAIETVIETVIETMTEIAMLAGRGSVAATARGTEIEVATVSARGILAVAPLATGINMGATIRETGTVGGMTGIE